MPWDLVSETRNFMFKEVFWSFQFLRLIHIDALYILQNEGVNLQINEAKVVGFKLTNQYQDQLDTERLTR